ncbi:Actin-related protein 5 [Zea mays]|uniref:Actin-related protein 5 n=1 Tax=Zea mays TaxID=4577 RepID=A0A1D6FE86_MAIZE|nr:Actin-related protein 5 [Zea mays]
MSSVTRPQREADFARFPSSTPIVIDNGASTFRIGWAGEAEPRLSFRNVVQRPRHRSTGETVSIVGDTDPSLMKFFDCTRSAVRSPFDDDVVYQFDVIYRFQILDYGFDRLGVDSEVGHPILMTECECNPSFSRARMSELLFETYGVPSIAFGIDNAFSYKYNQKLGNCNEDGLAISCEHGTCHVVPPGMIGIDQAGIDEMVSISLRRLMEDESVKERLCQSILVTGGSSLFPGMIPRLESGIRQYRPYLAPLKLVGAADPILDAWRGAAAFAASSKFGKQTFSLADYGEHGENLFHRYNIVYSL